MSYMNQRSALGQYQQVQASGASYADPHRLIQMLMEGALTCVAVAAGAIERGEIPAKAKAITRAIAIIDGLQDALDRSEGGDLVDNLDALYDYMVRRLALANAENDAAVLKEVSSLLSQIKEAWDAIPPEARAAKAG